MAAALINQLAGRAVEQIWIWGPVRFVFELGEHPSPGIYVDIWTGSYLDPTGTSVKVDTNTALRETGAVVELLRESVADASETSGTLTLTFANGAKLRAEPSDDYESWSVVVHGQTVQCLPGGEIGTW